MPFREIEHTADRRLEVEAENLDQLFAEAVAGLNSLYRPKNRNKSPSTSNRQKGIRRKKVCLEADTLEELLVAFLNEVIFLTEREKTIFTPTDVAVKPGKSTGYTLTASLIGGKIRPLTEIKSATYHQLRLKKKNGFWCVQIVFDI